MKRIDYLKPNEFFFETVNKKLKSNVFGNVQGFEDRENSIVVKLGHYHSGIDYKLIEVDKKDIEKYFGLNIEGEETIKI